MPKVFSETPTVKPYWKTKDGSLKLYHGDVIEVLNKLPEQSVQMTVSSPPYYGIRCYDGTATWEGGSPDCNHVENKRSDPSRLKSKDGHAPVAGCPTRDVTQVAKSRCKQCGAKRIDKQIGSEETIDLFVEKMVEVYRAVKRILRDDGTCWINLGDSYAANSYTEKRTKDTVSEAVKGLDGAYQRRVHRYSDDGKKEQRVRLGLKAGNLIGAPWRVALALQADGWMLRQAIVWFKTNPMPESVRNRCTKSHEYIFLLSKKMGYYYDCDAIREQTGNEADEETFYENYGGGVTGAGFEAATETRYGIDKSKNYPGMTHPNGRNKRDVWPIPSEAYGSGHFATFPQALVEPCILAGSKPGDVVLDPFVGSGTTLCVAMAHDRRGVGIDLSETYLKNNAIPRIEGALMSRPGKAHLIPGRTTEKVKGGKSLIK